MTFEVRSLDPTVLEPRIGARDDHFVELYDDDASLVESVRTYLSSGIAVGDAAVVIATPERRRAIEAALATAVDLAGARQRGLYQALDAMETLALFMNGDVVDWPAFESVIGDVVARASTAGRDVRLFGEMVAVLWAGGNVSAALALEDAWNRLAADRRFRLFCAYPSYAFSDDDLDALTGVCNRHSHVLLAAPRP